MANEEFMRVALRLAHEALAAGEVPVGAVVVKGGEIVGRGSNLVESLQDPTAHAEMIAITQAAARLDNWRLSGCTMYVTKEPCPMCAGAIYQARMEKLVYGCPDEKGGYAGTLYNVLSDAHLNHQVKVKSSVLADDCRTLLQDFFKRVREV